MELSKIMLKAKKLNKLLLFSALSLTIVGTAGCSMNASIVNNASHVKLSRVLTHHRIFHDTSLAHVVKSYSDGFGNTLTDNAGSPYVATFQHGKIGFGRHNTKKLHQFSFSGVTDHHNYGNPSDCNGLTEPPVYYHINNKKRELTIDNPYNLGNIDGIKYKLVFANAGIYKFKPFAINFNKGDRYHHVTKKEQSNYDITLIANGHIKK